MASSILYKQLYELQYKQSTTTRIACSIALKVAIITCVFQVPFIDNRHG